MLRNIAAKTKERSVTRLRTEFDELRVDLDGRDNATKMKARSESRTPPKKLKVIEQESFQDAAKSGQYQEKKENKKGFERMV